MIKLGLIMRSPMEVLNVDAIQEVQHEEDEAIFWALAISACPEGCLVVRNCYEEAK